MDRMLYLAMSAAKQTMNAQAVATNNLANAATTGFKADFEAQRAMQVYGPGHPARVYAMTERPGTVETRVESADIERAISSASPMIRLAFKPGAGSNS